MSDLASVMTHALELTTRLDRQSVLQMLVDSAVELAGCKYGALSVLDSGGETLQFVFTGIDHWRAERIGPPPKGHGVFGEMRDEHYQILEDLLKRGEADAKAKPEEFRRYGSARKLYNFNIDNASEY